MSIPLETHDVWGAREGAKANALQIYRSEKWTLSVTMAGVPVSEANDLQPNVWSLNNIFIYLFGRFLVNNSSSEVLVFGHLVWSTGVQVASRRQHQTKTTQKYLNKSDRSMTNQRWLHNVSCMFWDRFR